VQTPDDEQFELYLKRFDPITPEPIPMLRIDVASRHPFGLGTRLTAFAAILIIGIILVWHVRSSSRVVVSSTVRHAVSAERHAPLEPLTMRSASAWLTAAPSFKNAIDDLAFRSQSNPMSQDKQSAVAVLGKEKIKL
jgi:hypothetical protein